MDPLPFGMKGEVVAEVLGTIVVLSLPGKRAVSPFFESKEKRYALGVSLALAALSMAACTPYYSAQEIRNPNPQAYAWFGHAVAALGDVNGDGAPDFVVGAPYQQVGWNYGQGRAYVINGRDGSVIHTLDSSNGQEDGNFGRAVAGIADVDGDSVPDIAIGARGEADLVRNIDWPSGIYYELVGRVYIFSGQTGALIRVISNPAPQAWNEFGASLSSVGDLDNDGVPDLVVGTPSFHGYKRLTGSATWFCPVPVFPTIPPAPVFVPVCWQGRVYVFSGRTGSLIRAIDHPSPQELSFFGSSVAGAPDLDNDNFPDIVVSAPNQGTGLTGEVYVMSGQQGTLIRKIVSPQSQRIGTFGSSLAIRAQTGDILIGAPGESPAADQYQGRAWLIRGTDGAMLLSLDRPSALARARFGRAVAIAGDINGDAVSDLFIGAPGEYMFNDPSPQGSAFLLNGASGDLIRELKQPTPQPTSAYGRAVASIGDVNGDGRPDFVIGAPYWHRNDEIQFEGVVYLFTSRSWWCRILPWRC